MNVVIQKVRSWWFVPTLLCASIGGLLAFRFFHSEPSLRDAKAYYVPFDESMKVEGYANVIQQGNNTAIYNFFKDLYEKNSLKNVPFREKASIPKIIHVMWLGGALPQEYHRFVQSWYNQHPDWKILFWTDNEANYGRGTVVLKTFDELSQELQKEGGAQHIVIDSRALAYDNKEFYDKAFNYGEKSDILKWEIVYRFGGCYVDTDFECLKPLDIFHHRYDFYTGIQPLDTNMVQLGAALFAAYPNHPILQRCVLGIKENQHIEQIILKSGPLHFTRSFLATADHTPGSIDVAFPSSYFYPCDYEQRGMAEVIWRKPESFAIHHWAGSWLKPEGFVPGAIERLVKEGKIKLSNNKS
jgi:mannosyltransferase OCH1-like enzyme